VLFSIWETRVQDFVEFVGEMDYSMGTNMLTLNQRSQWRPTDHSWRSPGFTQTPAHPVVGVTWRDAEAFCAWLTEKERRAGLIATNQLYRLPMAGEWMRVAGDTLYPWGDDWPPPPGAGNYAGAEIHKAVSIHRTIAGYDDGFAATSPVGSFKPNPNGLYDLGGNVWEFCSDGPADDGNSRWMMGGSWENATEESLTVANRARGNDARRYSHRGFRCVLASANE
jgi:formylglycine-generating enzyme required for sulfatase activity